MNLSTASVYKGHQYFGRAEDVNALFDYCMGTSQAIAIAEGAGEIDASLGTLFEGTIEADTTLTVKNVRSGVLHLKLKSVEDVGGFSVTLGTGFKSASAVAMGMIADKYIVLEFVSNGTVYCEVSRTGAM